VVFDVAKFSSKKSTPFPPSWNSSQPPRFVQYSRRTIHSTIRPILMQTHLGAPACPGVKQNFAGILFSY
jgi:hypothetical protein